MSTAGVYILKSQRNGRYYIGSTIDVARRLEEHNHGKVKATRYIQPLILKAFIPCIDIASARQAEYRLKQYKRTDIIEQVIKQVLFPWNYKDI